MKKYFVIIPLIFALTITTVRAQEASTTGTIRDAVKAKVTEELAQIKKAVAKRAYVGKVATKTDATITLTNLKNATRTITVTADTTIKLASGGEGTPADIKVDNHIIAMGDVDSSGVMTAKRIVITPAIPAEKRKAIFITYADLKAKNLKSAAGVKFAALKDTDKLIVILNDTTILKIKSLTLPTPTPTP